jgi:hypothetical protein
MLTGKTFCHGCFSKLLSHPRIRAGVHFCAECDPKVPDRIEVLLRPLISAAVGFPASAMDDVVLGGTGCDAAKRRPDWGWFWKDRAVFVEIDEGGGHPDREPSCELAKMHDQAFAAQRLLGPVPVWFFRFNPDECDGPRVCLDDRVSLLADAVTRVLTLDITELSTAVPRVCYMFYHSKCAFQAEAARKAVDSFVVINA